MSDKIEMSKEKACKNCIHYQMCVDTFRKGKQDGEYLLIEEEAYFVNADGCDFYVDKRIYRKQNEWISVNEMLPEKAGRYLVYGVIGSQTLMCGMYYNKYSGFDDEITHWMPLPEPPIMKDDVE